MLSKLTFAGTKRKKTFLLLLGVVIWIAAGSIPAFAAEVFTDTTEYPPGDTANIDGITFWSEEIVTLQITNMDGTPLEGEAGLPWDVLANSIGDFETAWILPFENIAETLLVTAIGTESGLTAETSFLAPKTYLNQLQNGTTTTPPQWANGNINGSNSCYSEGHSVPYRYFIKQLDGGTGHYLTIQMEWTKGGIHALDYLTDYDATEDSAITLTGGPCGTISTTPPPGCSAPTDSLLLPDPTDSNNYTGAIPSDFFTKVNPSFVLDGPRYLKAYNVTIDSVSKYYFTGTSSDREFNVEVYFTTDTTGSVGIFWGGHLAAGNDNAWGFGNGSASVSGAPYHMRAKNLDGGGAAGQDRSIQNGVICLPPDVSIICDNDTLCADTSFTYVCSDTSDANTWTWTVINGAIIGSNTLDSVVFYVNPGLGIGDTVVVSVIACDSTGGCPGDFCCAEDTLVLPVVPPPVAYCPNDTSLFVCDLSDICIPGFSCDNADSSQVIGGTLGADIVCFTPVPGVNTIKLICFNECGADTCVTTINVTLNSPPVASCPGDDSMFVCDLSDICVAGFTASDPDNNIASVTVTGGTLSGDTVCFTPSVGSNTITLIVTDVCGEADTCQTTIEVALNSPPVASCPGDDSMFVCDLSDICVAGFTASDPDNNIASVTVTGGTLSGDTVCFTPSVGSNTITLIVTDVCGEADTCQTTINVTLNSSPICQFPSDTTVFQCGPQQICLDVSATDVDGNLSHCSVYSGSGSIVSGQWCFTPSGSGQYSATIRCYDSCGAYCEGTITVTVQQNVAPQLTCPTIIDTFLCAPDSVCYSVTVVDPDDGITGTVSPVGSFNAGTSEVCFYADTAGTYVLTLIVSDGCGAKDTCVTTINVTLNNPPVASCPGDDTMFVCDLSDICIDGFTATDPDNNIASVTVTGGTLSGDTVCFTPSVGSNTITLIVTDDCGEADTCQTTIHVALNNPPVASCPGDDTMFVCDLSDICIDGFTTSDPDNNIASVTVTGGMLSGDTVCFTPSVGGNIITLIVTDDCGEADTCQTTITVALNSAPVATCPGDDTMFVCDLSDICIGGFATSDVDNNISSVVVTGGTLSGDTVCFTPSVGSNTITLIVTDDCGEADTCQTTITVTMNTAPVATCPGGDTMFVCDLSPICLAGFSCSDVDANLVSCVATGGTLSGDTVCFTPTGSGTHTIILTAIDACGLVDVCTTHVTVTLNSPPVATCPGDDTLFVCNLSMMCIPGFGASDPNNNIASVVVTGGTLIDDTLCFNPVPGPNVITFIVTDSCGEADTCQTIIYVDLNSAPVASCPGDDSMFVCDLSDICITGFSVTDADNNLASVDLFGGTFTGGDTVCFTPSIGANTITLIAMDSCGLVDSCMTTIYVALNNPPVASCPGSDTIAVCDLSDICISGFACSDVDNNLVSCEVSKGTLNSGQVCFTPIAGINVISLVATDSCGAADTCTTMIFVMLNTPPIPICPDDTIIQTCVLPDSVCIIGFGVDDPDGGPFTTTINGQTYSLGTPYCFIPGWGINVLIFEVTDPCGASAQCTTHIGFLDSCYLDCPTIMVEKTHMSIQGQHEYVDVSVINPSAIEWGGFDFLLVYDRSAVNFQTVLPGHLYDICGWEYFTYRTWFWPSYEPHFFWGGVIRVVGLAELNNGAAHPTCFILPPPFVLFTLDFVVTDNRLFECQYVPIGFFWADCNDNTISSVTGDTLLVSRFVYGFDQVGLISDPNTGFPTYTGVQSECLIGGGEGKPAPIQCIDFIGGGIDIACADSLDDRGDINLNGVAYEIADAVVFTNYFIYGFGAFSINLDGQIAATDCNADGLALTVGDLVYLVRVVVGDALPYAKLASVEATYRVDNGVISVSGRMGAALVVIESRATPTLLANGMEMKYNYDREADVTRALVYSLEGNDFSGRFLDAGGSVVSIELGSYQGAVVRAVEAPVEFALHHNYPNPFNPTTTISFSLPAASDYTLTIYNVTGQQVTEFSDRAEAGLVTVEWDASELASGVYFYRLRAGDRSATKKMLLLK